MELKKTEAIILRTRDLGESDLLVSFFSAQYGNLKGIAKGARRSSKRFVNSLSTFSLGHIEFREKRSGDLVFLESCELLDGFPGIRADYRLLLKASYMVELTEILFPSNVPSLGMFDILKLAFGALSNGRGSEECMLAFRARAMKTGGFGINLSRCSRCTRQYKGEGRALFSPLDGSIVCMACERETALMPGMEPETVRVLHELQSSDQLLPEAVKLNESTIRELKAVLKAHIEHCLGRQLKSAKYLE